MKKFLYGSVTIVAMLGGQAVAAALPARAPVYKAAPMVAAPFSWTGCYVGGNVGYTRQSSRVGLTGTDTDGGGFGSELADGSTPRVFDARFSGVLGGGQVGCNWQSGSIVWGIEGDIDWSDANRTITQTNHP